MGARAVAAYRHGGGIVNTARSASDVARLGTADAWTCRAVAGSSPATARRAVRGVPFARRRTDMGRGRAQKSRDRIMDIGSLRQCVGLRRAKEPDQEQTEIETHDQEHGDDQRVFHARFLRAVVRGRLRVGAGSERGAGDLRGEKIVRGGPHVRGRFHPSRRMGTRFVLLARLYVLQHDHVGCSDQ
jgi:hypothetical protein